MCPICKKWYTPQKNFVLPQYRLHTDFSKEGYAENLAKIALELSVLEPIQQGGFFVPNLGQKMYVPDKILGCLYIIYLKKQILVR